MTKIAYRPQSFRVDSLDLIARAEIICQRYADQGYALTLRGLYYQLVAGDIIPNTMQSYKRIGSLINDARLAGLIDWDHLTDSGRNLSRTATWNSPTQIMDAVASQYRENRWRTQLEYIEIWVEKDALSNVIGRAARRWQVPWFACKGYVSQSEMHDAARRLRAVETDGRKVTIVHLGDHDPSGLDMTRDIRDRLELFGCELTVNRIALNRDQIDQYQPPPNPAKITDSRATGYISEFGFESWELDALPPDVLDALVDGEIRRHLDMDAWERAVAGEESNQQDLITVARRWPTVVDLINAEPEDDEDDE